MFCLKCGEAIPDGSKQCPLCGCDLEETSEQAVVYASQKDSPPVVNNTKDLTKSYYAVIALVIASFVFLAFNYFRVSIDLYFGGSSDSEFSGYGLISCLGGTARLSGLMVILLIFVNIATAVTAGLGIKGSSVSKDILNKLMLVEVVGYMIATIVPFFHITTLLQEFDSSLAETSIGLGCYLNIAVAIAMVILYFKDFSKKV